MKNTRTFKRLIASRFVEKVTCHKTSSPSAIQYEVELFDPFRWSIGVPSPTATFFDVATALDYLDRESFGENTP